MLINFKRLTKSDILFLDNNLLNLSFKGVSSLVYNFNEIRVYYFFKSLCDFIFKSSRLTFRQIYKKKIFEAISAKVVISNHLNQRSFEYKYLMPQSKVITYQLSIINDYSKKILKKYNYKKVDYFFVFSEIKKKKLKNIFKTQYITAGSCRSNSIRIAGGKKYDICYISEYAGTKKFKEKNSKKINNIHYKNQKLIVKNIKKYCAKNKKKFVIALRSSRVDKKNNKGLNFFSEINYFKSLIANNFLYKKNMNSYNIADQSKLVVCLSSTLGVELLGRGIKVLFLPLDEITNKSKFNPYLKFNRENHISSDKNPVNVFNLVKKYDLLKINEWKKIKKKSFFDIRFNNNNQILKKKIFEILKTINEQ